MTPERLGKICWTFSVVCQRRYQGPMDGGARAAQSVCVHVTDAVRASECNQLIIDTIAELACQPAPTDSPSSSTTVPTEHELTG